MFELPKLNYPYDALEPYFDKQTMKIHHTKHHQAYLDNFNKALENYPEIQNMSPEQILKGIDKLDVPEDIRSKIKNHGGGYINHNIFFDLLGPKKEINHELVKQIEEEYGNIKNMIGKFDKVANTHFGSGWTWLVKDETGKLKIYSLPNQDSPYTLGHTPIINLDLWEHSYYLKYQNKRAEYIENWWNVLKIM